MQLATRERVVRLLNQGGHEIFLDDRRNFNLNIVGIRNPFPELDRFGCQLAVFWKYAGEFHFREWPITTYPGSHYLIDKLLNPRGAAILAPGQYRGVYRLDLHNGRYQALCQRGGPVRVFRDGNRDRVFDLDPESVEGGWFGINIHAPVDPAAGRNYVKDLVRASSAGCQVFQRVADFLEFRQLCREAMSRWGNSFTYTLVEGD